MHRQAAAVAAAAWRALDEHTPVPPYTAEQHDLAERLRSTAARLAPGWLGASLGAMATSTPLGGHDMPPYVRIGTAQPLDDAGFPAIVPLLTQGHLTIDADARDPRVAGLLRALVLRLLASAPAGTLRVRTVTAPDVDKLFAPFAPLAGTTLMPPPVTERTGLQTVLAEAEQWVRLATMGRRHPARDRLLLLVLAALPELTDPQDLARIVELAQAGPPTGLHLVVAGWPPPPLTEETTQELLPLATAVSVRNPYAVVGPPPGASFGTAPAGAVLNSPVFLDDDPSDELIEQVCRELADQAEAAARLRLSHLIPDCPNWTEWTEEATDGLVATVGFASESPVTLRFNDLVPHWMVGGRAGAGKSAFLLNVLYGLATRYPPDELAIYLLGFTDGTPFKELTPTEADPTWLPHVRVIGIESDRAYGLAVLRELTAELDRRADAYQQAGVAKFAQARAAGVALTRILCVIDEFQILFGGDDHTAAEAVTLLDRLARKGRAYGVHLVLASQHARAVAALHTKRDSVFGQIPVRIALPGGSEVLDPANESAAGLPVGAAVVNTAGGFGGPRGATRGHETTVFFPDPYAEPEALTELRHHLWKARAAGSGPPHVFAGYAQQHLADDRTFARLAPAERHPTVLIGRTIDVELPTAAYQLDARPGRHLAVLGPSSAAVGLLDAAARSVAAQHRPGTARFLLVPLAPDTLRAAARLTAALEGQGHPVSTLDGGPGTLDEFTRTDQPTYLLLFGADTANLESTALRAALREGPARGHYLFGWWRGLRRFVEQVGPAGPTEMAGLVFLNIPGAEVDLLLGREFDWCSRPNRALFHDQHTERTAVIVPFTPLAERGEAEP